MTAAHGPHVLRDVEVPGHGRTDVLLQNGVIEAIGAGLEGPTLLHGAGGALLPGLHDHHVHLLAMAAAARSVPVGPEEVGDRRGLTAALRGATPDADGWIRATGYHEDVAGSLDRHVLDEVAPGRRVRVQHRSGQLWILSSAGLDAVLTGGAAPPCVELDGLGRPTGRVWRGDDWLRSRLPPSVPDLAEVGRTLADHGVTGLTDATPIGGVDDAAPLLAAAGRQLPQRLVLMSAGPLVLPAGRAAEVGPIKVVLDEGRLPGLAALADQVRGAHRLERAVAVHCVTLAELALAVAAFEDAGPVDGDRIEHGGVVPRAWAERLAALGLTVVTQPSFVHERGDSYRRDVDPADLADLYPCASLLVAGVRVAGSTDAPYASADPWAAMRAAVTRRTRQGHVIGATEAVDPQRALALFLGAPGDPGGPPRRVTVGAPADLCLLQQPLDQVLAELRTELVAATLVGGRVVAAGDATRLN